MKKLLTVFLCSFFLFGTVAVCSALQFTLQNYTVSAQSSDPGLVIQTQNSQSNDFDFNLNLGESTTFDLFDIWTNESAVNNDDTAEKPISVAMNFSAPPPPFGTETPPSGVTYGYRETWGFFQGGVVNWNGPVDISFGPSLDGTLRVSLSNETFNDGILWGTGCSGATVQATFTYVGEASAAPVPEPSTILLMGAGLLGLVAVGRRKFNPKE